MAISDLVRKYEASGDAGAVSDGSGDLGGISYGIYQLSSTAGSVQNFVSFACNYSNSDLANYGNVLSQYDVNSDQFISEWKSLGENDQNGFSKLQDEYAKSVYYDSAVYNLKNHYYNADDRSEAIQAVIMSRSVQYSAGNIVELFTEAVHRLGYDNLSYVNDSKYDGQMISAVYDFLVDECDNATESSNGLYHSQKDWANGSYSVVKIGLKNRFINEKQDALNML